MNKSNSGVPGLASGPRMQELRLSASMFMRTADSITRGCFFNKSAVSAEPVNAIASWPVTLSVNSRAEPQTIERTPGGNTPASITSLTIW